MICPSERKTLSHCRLQFLVLLFVQSMQASSLISKTKRKKLKTGKETDSGGKSISNLPQEVLEHIVSFLPIQEAIRTSILSKKWLNLWKSAPNLIFRGGYSPKRKLYMDFVERVLVLRGPSNIEKFHLLCEAKDDQSRIGTWISAAVNRNVKDVYLCLRDFESSFVFPRCLFNCETLTEFEIDMLFILKLPSSISLPCLKILNLSQVTFIDDQSTQQLFSLPNLVELEIYECNWKNLVWVTICAPKLKQLAIYESHESTPANSGGCHVRIFRTHLANFSCGGTLSNEFCLDESSAVKTCISLFSDSDRLRETACRSYKLLEGISSVETLYLTIDVVHVLDHASDLLAFPLEFRKLTTLIFDSDKLKLHSAGFWHIIYNSPNLRALHFSDVKLSKVPSNCREDGTLDPAPLCFLSSLHFIQVANFVGGEKAIDAVGFLLKNATALDKMSVCWAGNQVMTNKIRRQLLDLPGWSKVGKINYG